MMSPNYKDFPAPESHQTFNKYIYKDNNDTGWHQIINNHHFNSKVIVQMPDTPRLPDEIKNGLTVDTEYYLVKDLPIYHLVLDSFIQAFVQNGSINAVSCNTNLDTDNSAAMTSSGVLYLLLDHFTYHELAIQGDLSKHILRTPRNKFIVKIDTKQSGFISGMNYYEKIISVLKNSNITFDFWISWTPNDESICPSTIAMYFNDDLGFNVEEKHPILNSDLRSDVITPAYNGTEDVDLEEATHLLEWIGSQALNFNLPHSGIEEKCDDSTPSTLNVCHANGFYTPHKILNLINILREWLNLRSSTTVPWVSLTVYGPPDALLSWGTTEHCYFVNGDNFYTILLFRENIWIYKLTDRTTPQRLYVKSSNK